MARKRSTDAYPMSSQFLAKLRLLVRVHSRPNMRDRKTRLIGSHVRDDGLGVESSDTCRERLH